MMVEEVVVTIAHSQREKQRLLAMLFSTSKGEISKSKSLDFAIAFPLGGGTCSTLALLQFEKIVLKVIFYLDCSIFVLIYVLNQYFVSFESTIGEFG